MKVQIRTKNHTAAPLRGSINSPIRTVVRLGSHTPTERVFPRGIMEGKRIFEINTVEAIQNSSNKMRMKRCFRERNVPQAIWWELRNGRVYNPDSNDEVDIEELPYPIVVKRINGFKGHGMCKVSNSEEFRNWLSRGLHGYFVEKFYNYGKEYRLHVSAASGVFLVWRKLRRADAENKWFFNSTNCNWVGINNDLFDTPPFWEDMKRAAVDALHSTGLDLGAVDIRCRRNPTRGNNFIVCEVNSAPALGEIGIESYRSEISKLIENYV